MAIDQTIPVRRAGMGLLEADEPLAAIVASEIHPQVPLTQPPWPFVKWGAFTTIPVRASCVDGGCELVGAVHGFAKRRENGSGQVVETAEDHAGRLGNVLMRALDGKRAALPEGGNATFHWTNSQLLIDGGEADAFHAVVNFRVRVIA